VISRTILPVQPPKPEEPVHSPMIYVKEDPSWEYKQLVRDLASDKAPTEEELNALGRAGWELVSTVSHATQVYFYFKRVKG
jgi:hypothetical protein